MYKLPKPAKSKRGIFSEKLVCRYSNWEILDKTTLRLNLPPFNCTDMKGAIFLAKKINPEVRLIIVYEASTMINVYFLRDQKWEAFSWPHHYEGVIAKNEETVFNAEACKILQGVKTQGNQNKAQRIVSNIPTCSL